MAKLELQNVKKNYGATEVIPGIDLTIEPGEFLVLVGPSGSGKSTLLRMIAGLEETTGGNIVVDGDDITRTDPSARDLAMVFQTYALYPHMTVEQNMSFALRMRKEDPAAIAQRVEEAIVLLDLAGLEKRKPGQLSGGQRQRVAMGRCIVRNPKLFLFDEPLSNLDAKLRAQTRLEIRKLHDRLGATSIFVTHDQVEAMTMADRIALLKDGTLQQLGTPQDLYLNPANTFVAGFMGTPEMGLFPGVLRESGSDLLLEGEHSMALPAEPDLRTRLGEAVKANANVTVGVRPEHFAICPAQTPGSMSIEVSAIEWLGHDIYVFGEAGGKTIAARLSGNDETGRRAAPPRVGEPIGIKPIEGSWHVFDAETGRNLLASTRAPA
ncbi:ABC transporter ATP-binding protein [Pelagibacterium halotolerans]|uniref:SN-glycerol-3-phosphate transport ATP-binding protein UgpC n=1 Tax=Pelagibacterium halotolerans (strain DSM 22347 / JCM 15775 / CGMCC 1.7692 / B2) TaxID=1082931 RepID=G4R7B1_PELHB|nr:sn-glycerol-3-phosphate ABC transporter ATP-binding protein UgpC [Pelagibacterium halotolerans]AEQ51247.1 SN-glycerol-3-phosphate transport ATP-binding protein UgpC [Pelagibacterium halotolerans B2]QJR18893.1 sn-glycerol-3-phosphate ABC transporter ATP-binding protein UgpC [Pelagibacterium halotolerans]SEA67382.1 sn-glycerol 3-phosphate transport system ATP-binding protein/multiple sugar transport system ATP-binding protein/multiple sugar transport system ATP-binding protein [Pelagibacterium 